MPFLAPSLRTLMLRLRFSARAARLGSMGFFCPATLTGRERLATETNVEITKSRLCIVSLRNGCAKVTPERDQRGHFRRTSRRKPEGQQRHCEPQRRNRSKRAQMLDVHFSAAEN